MKENEKEEIRQEVRYLSNKPGPVGEVPKGFEFKDGVWRK